MTWIFSAEMTGEEVFRYAAIFILGIFLGWFLSKPPDSDSPGNRIRRARWNQQSSSEEEDDEDQNDHRKSSFSTSSGDDAERQPFLQPGTTKTQRKLQRA